MKVFHDLGGRKIAGTSEDGFYLLLNQEGDYLSFPAGAASRYHGWVIRENGGYFKIFDSLGLALGGDIHSVSLSADEAVGVWGRRRENVILGEGHSFSVRYAQPAVIEPAFDVRPLFSAPEWGRAHNVMIFDDHAVVKASLGDTSFFVVCLSDKGAYEEKAEWRFRTYLRDRSRNSPPYYRHVFVPFKAEGSRFGFGVSKDPRLAYALAAGSLADEKSRQTAEIYPPTDRLPKGRELPADVACAEESARRSLARLYLPRIAPHWLRAGLPWFFNLWPRDALVSLPALPRTVQKEALERFWPEAMEHYPFPASAGSERAAADALGWLSARTDEFPAERRRFIESHFLSSLAGLADKLLRETTRDGLAVGGPGETWMDTLDRSGARLELQALRLRLYRLLYRFTRKKRYEFLEKNLKERLREKFWNGRYLQDAPHDPTIRPNIYLAAYLCPDLLDSREWLTCFREAHAALFLPWGGLSTIDRRDPRFVPTSTGEDPRSYHNGDSWFYLNNLAAIVLHRLAPGVFKAEIQKILKASTEEILWRGALGHHGELSSANKLESSGAWAQAWSNAMYLELVSELYGQ